MTIQLTIKFAKINALFLFLSLSWFLSEQQNGKQQQLSDLNGALSQKSTVFFTVLFVCVEVLQPSQPNWVMSSAVSLPNHLYWAVLVL